MLGADVGAEAGAVARALALLTNAADPGDGAGFTERPLGTPVGLGLSTAGLGPMAPLDALDALDPLELAAFGAALGMEMTTRSVILGVAMSLERILTFSRFMRCTLFSLDDSVDVDVDETDRGMRLVPGPALCDRRLFILPPRDVVDAADGFSKRRFTWRTVSGGGSSASSTLYRLFVDLKPHSKQSVNFIQSIHQVFDPPKRSHPEEGLKLEFFFFYLETRRDGEDAAADAAGAAVGAGGVGVVDVFNVVAFGSILTGLTSTLSTIMMESLLNGDNSGRCDDS